MEQLQNVLLSGSIPAAKALLGWKLVHETDEGRMAGYIVETEAYDQVDPASHTYTGMTSRNAAMFERAGTLYVYFTYGLHYCLNIVTGTKGEGQGVLIRALEPLEGLERMRELRNTSSNLLLTNGPAKLVQALGVTIADNATSLGEKIYLEAGFHPQEIIQTPRIGITQAKDELRRFYVAGNPYVSHTKKRY